jgi:hypothetical protein
MELILAVIAVDILYIMNTTMEVVDIILPLLNTIVQAAAMYLAPTMELIIHNIVSVIVYIIDITMEAVEHMIKKLNIQVQNVDTVLSLELLPDSPVLAQTDAAGLTLGIMEAVDIIQVHTHQTVQTVDVASLTRTK